MGVDRKSDEEPAYWDRRAGRYAALRELFPAEVALVRRFEAQWPEWDVLDLGVGAGRTARALAGRARSYVGIDYSPQMVEQARRAVPESENVTLAVCDARDLSPLGAQQFDFVLFSFNGIDCVDLEGRIAVLREVHRVLRPDGYFAFSSHSLFALPLSYRPLPALELRHPHKNLTRLARCAYSNLGPLLVNLRTDPREARRRGFATLWDGLPRRGRLDAYVTPEFQIGQLQSEGFSLLELYGGNGDPVDPTMPGSDPWLDYLCQPVSRGEPEA